MPRKQDVLYWGIDLELSDILINQEIKTFLDNHPELIQLKKVHSTLFFVGRKKVEKTEKDVSDILENMSLLDPEEPYKKLNGKECELIINAFGYSDDAIALNVQTIKIKDDDSDCPTNAKRQHITIALKTGIKAVDSVKTLLGDGTIHELSSSLILKGFIKSFFY